jgi:hypothetical protein
MDVVDQPDNPVFLSMSAVTAVVCLFESVSLLFERKIVCSPPATSDGMMEVRSVLVVVAMWPGGRFQLCGDSDLWASSPQSWTDCAVRRRTLGALFLPFKTTLFRMWARFRLV